MEIGRAAPFSITAFMDAAPHAPVYEGEKLGNLQPGWRFGLGSSVRLSSDPGLPEQVAGEVSWGGLAGTIWWINPTLGIGAVLLTQRYFGFGNPYAYEFHREAYKALGH